MLTGATGPTGPQGNQGRQGAVGAQGAQGRQGAVGAQGAQGAGGLTTTNASTLDSLDSTQFLRSDADDTSTGRLTLQKGFTGDSDYHLYIKQTTNAEGATIRFTDASGETQFGLVTYKHSDSHSNSAANSFHFNSSESSTAVIIDQTAGNSGFYVGTNKVWHAGNDGASSGLDADTLDGVQGSNYLRSNTSDTMSGNLTVTGTGSFGGKVDFQGDAAIQGGSGYGIFKGYTSNDNHFIVVRGKVTTGQSTLEITGTHRTTFVEHAENNDTTGWYFVSKQTGSYSEIARITRTGGIHLQGNKVWHAGNDGSGSGLDADTVDGVQASSFAQKSGATFTGDLRVDNDADLRIGDGSANERILIQKADNNVSDHIIFYNGTTRMGEIGCEDTTWLRINQETAKNIYTPRYIRADGGFFVDGTAKGINGSGNFIGGTIAGASDYSTLLRSNANDTLSAIITGHASDTEVLRVRSSSYSSNYLYIGGWSSANSNDIARIRSSSNLHIDGPADGNLYLNWYASNKTIHLGNTGQVVKAAGSNTVWHAGNDGSGSGLDADTLDGAQPSASAGNNTIVKRHSNGYIFANYFNTTPNDVSSGVTKVCVETGNDGYIRHGSAGAIRTFLGIESGATADQTASEILTAIKTVDGSGSGLDADLLDGINSGSFLRSDANDSTSGTLSVGGLLSNTGGAKLEIQNETNGGSSKGIYFWSSVDSNWVHYMGQAGSGKAADAGTACSSIDGRTSHHIRYRVNNHSSNGHLWENTSDSCLMSLTGDTGKLYVKGDIYAGNSTSNKVWHAGNDGSGSGLDADLLDGQQGSSYLRSNTNDTFTGQLTISGNLILSDQVRIGDDAWIEDWNSANSIRIKGNQNSNQGYIAFGNRSEKLGCNNSSTLQYNGSTVWHAGNDGSGSGLDADTVDGVQASSFLRSDAADTVSGNISFTSTTTPITTNSIKFNNTEMSSAHYTDATGVLAFDENFSSDTEYGSGTYDPNTVFTGGGGGLLIKNQDGWGAVFTSQNTRWASAQWANLTATGNINSSSDVSLKDNITTIPNALDKVLKMRGVEYDRNDMNGEHQIGLIAQEIEEVVPEIVSQDESTGLKSVSYGNITAILIEAIKEQQKEINKLKIQNKLKKL